MGQTAFSGYVNIDIATTADEAAAGTPGDGANMYVEQPAGTTAEERVLLLRFTVGNKTDLSLPETAILQDIEVKLYQTTSDSLTVTLKKLKYDFVESLACWDNYDGSSSWNPDEAVVDTQVTGEYAAVEVVGSHAWTGGGTGNISLEVGVKENKWDFDSTINLIGYSNTTAESQFDHDGGTNVPQYRVKYEIPEPDGPTITVTPQDNGIDGYINITKHSENHTGYQAVYKDNSATVTFSSGDYSASITNTGLDQFDTTTVWPPPLGTEDRNVAFVVYAEDSLNIQNNGGKGNVVSVARPDVNTAVGYTDYTDSSDPAGSSGAVLTGANNIDIGEEMALVVTGATGGASAGTLGFFKSVYVNWDSGTSDTNADYTKYTLDEPATTTVDNIALTHRYSTEGAKVIKVQLEDVNGWRSNKTAITGTQPDTDGANPIASLTASKTKAIAANYGDRTSAIVLSGQQSRPVGSDRKLTNYLFSYTPDAASTIMTSNALNNDNSVFDVMSKRVAFIHCGDPDLSDTKFKVFGLASFDSAGDPIIDDSANLSHYKYASDEITVHATQLTQSTASTNFYKTIECIVGTALDADDEGFRYVLQAASASDAATPTINPDVRVCGRGMKNHAFTSGWKQYHWGGLARWASNSTTNNKTDFIAYADTTSNLAEAVDTTETNLLVNDAAPILGGGTVIQIDDEVMYVTAIDTGAPDNIDVIRGFCGTQAVEHDNATDIYFAGQMIIEGTNDDDDSTNPISDWYVCGFYDGDIIKVGETTNNGTHAAPKYYKMKGAGKASGNSGLYTRLAIEPLTANLSAKEKGYLTTNFTTESNTVSDAMKHNDSPSITATMFNTSGAGLNDTVTFYHGIIDDNITAYSAGDIFENALGETTGTIRFSQPRTLDLDDEINNGAILIQSATLSRSGGLGSSMPLGERRYPIGAIRTKIGTPTVTVRLRVITQAGLRAIWSLIEGDTYDYTFLDSRKINTPTLPYRSLRMRLDNGTLDRDSSMANQYSANLNFIVLGEDVT